MTHHHISLTQCFCPSLFLLLIIGLTTWSYLYDYRSLHVRTHPNIEGESIAVREGRLSPSRRLLDCRDECSVPPERRFDCARDRALSRAECETRGCCYVPLPAGLSGGPPWCFYPPSYPGYKMGSFFPTSKGRAANLTRSKPSYLPRDIATLRLEVAEETAGRLHLTVSQWIGK